MHERGRKLKFLPSSDSEMAVLHVNSQRKDIVTHHSYVLAPTVKTYQLTVYKVGRSGNTKWKMKAESVYSDPCPGRSAVSILNQVQVLNFDYDIRLNFD